MVQIRLHSKAKPHICASDVSLPTNTVTIKTSQLLNFKSFYMAQIRLHTKAILHICASDQSYSLIQKHSTFIP